MRARRALLYTPGDDLKKITKAAALGVDCLCMDIEDGVAFSRKAEARQTIVEALQALDFGRSERLVRINAVGSGMEDRDLQAIFTAGAHVRPDGVVLPKAETAGQVQWVSAQIAAAEARFGWPAGGIALIIQIETAPGLVNIREVLSADPRLQAVIFGAEDLAASMGAKRTPAGWEVFYARGAVVAHAAAFDLQAIDMVYVDFHDQAGLEAEARQGAQMGYEGKQIIHPNQVAPVQQAFTPDEAEIAQARRVMEAFQQHDQAGRGAFALDGKMVDAPIVKAAARILARAAAAGKG
ncbi:MAG TPA: CoA ester lyase [Anaerolineales bacterium]|nr:CoA ester lyase [Anaerolineales bacterium]